MMLDNLWRRTKVSLISAPRGRFWTYFVAATFFNIGFSIFFFLFNLYLLGFGLNERSLGLIGSAMAAGSLFGTIPAGICAERFGLRSTLIGGIALACCVSIMRVFFVGQSAQFALAVIGGMALCTWAVCLSPSVASLTTEAQRPVAFSLMFASGIGVAGLGGLIAGNLPDWFSRHGSGDALSVLQSERAGLLLGCGIAALSIIPLACLRFRDTPVPRGRLILPRSSFLFRFLPAIAVWALVTGAFPPFANVYFVHHLGLPLRSMGSVFSISQLVQFVAILIAPLLLRRVRLTTGVMLTQLATAAALLSLACAHTLQHSSWVYWIYMAAQYSNEPGIYSLLMESVPVADRTMASSLTFFTQAIANIIASAAVGASVIYFGYSPVLCMISALAVLAAILFHRLRNPRTSE